MARRAEDLDRAGGGTAQVPSTRQIGPLRTHVRMDFVWWRARAEGGAGLGVLPRQRRTSAETGRRQTVLNWRRPPGASHREHAPVAGADFEPNVDSIHQLDRPSPKRDHGHFPIEGGRWVAHSTLDNYALGEQYIHVGRESGSQHRRADQ